MEKINGLTLNERIDSLVKQYSDNNSFLPVISEGLAVFPGFCDVHVHLREPGFFYKEGIKTGTLAAAHGGYTAVCSMPNLNPVPDSFENLSVQLDIIKKDAVIDVYPYGAITVGEGGKQIADIKGMAAFVCGFSDDGKGVQSRETMESAMAQIKQTGKVLAAHCEYESLLNGGYIRNGEYCNNHGHKGIPPESEYLQVERDIELAERTGVKYHVCHVSTKESVELIRAAKKRGVDVTCETAPHYLILTEADLQEDGRFKMNPPLGDEKDREALIAGVNDGTVDMIATDHAPHSLEEKAKGLKDSLFGITGIETAFAVMYTKLVKTGKISLERLIQALAITPRKRFNIPLRKNDYTVFSLDEEYAINTDKFISKGKSTPFENLTVCGKCLKTVCGGQIVWQENSTKN